jgi:hypothetical protein
LPRNEALIFVAGTKPLRAKKLRFDREPAFIDRLLPPVRQAAALTTTHDWEGVRALGVQPQPERKVRSRPVLADAPAPMQPDLFAPPAGAISMRARAGFVDADGAPLAHPSAAAAAGERPSRTGL